MAGRETATENNILWGLKHCAEKRTTKIAVLDFPNGGFDEQTIERAIKRYEGLKRLNDGQYLKFSEIICVQDEKIVYRKTYQEWRTGGPQTHLKRNSKWERLHSPALQRYAKYV